MSDGFDEAFEGAGSGGGSSRDLLQWAEVPLRRPFLVLIPFALIVALATTAAFVLPERFESSTLIFVDQQTLPDEVFDKVTPTQRLRTLKQELLARTRLERIIEELDPYRAKQTKAPLSTQVLAMRSAVNISVKHSDAFSIDYRHADPEMARRVTDRLAQLFIEEQMSARSEHLADAEAFMATQLAEAEAALEEQEDRLRKFKEVHLGRLPEQTQANLATLQRLQLEQQTVEQSLQAAMDRASLLRQRPTYQAVPGSPDAGSVQLAQLREELADLRSRYTEEHPEVRRLRNRIDRLQTTLASRGLDDEEEEEPYVETVNPQLSEAELAIAELESRRDSLAERIARFQFRVEQAPSVEQELAVLTRDYAQRRDTYIKLLDRKMELSMANTMQKQHGGERFRVLDPASMPEEPIFPNKRLIIALGIAVGLLVGVALALAADIFDHSLKSIADLEEALPFPVLAILPRVVRDPAS